MVAFANNPTQADGREAPSVRAGRFTESAKARLGFGIWEGLGTVDGLPRAWQGQRGRSGENDG